MNYSTEDVHRSLRRYVSLMLGSPPWRVRTERQPMTPDERQVVVVEPSAPLSTGSHRTSIPQGDVQKLQAFSAMAYPALGEVAAESRLEAAKVADVLDRGFSHGLVSGPFEEGSNIGGPMAVPIYDFDGVPVTGKSRAGGDVPYGIAKVEDISVRWLQDEADPLRFTVACDVRLSWWTGGRLRPPAPLVRQIPPTPSVR